MASEVLTGGVIVAGCDLGRGLFAARPFAPGEPILRFSGRRLGLAEAVAKGAAQCNTLQVGPTEYIDLDPPGVFTNHSCDPNAGLVDDVLLVALREIAAGEEVRFDYSTTMWEDLWTMPCRCGAPACRRVVEDFPLLPAELRARYLALGVVQRFIVERLRAANA